MQILTTAERQVKDLPVRRSRGHLFELKDSCENFLVNAERGAVVCETWTIVQIEDLRADERRRRIATQLIGAWHIDPEPDVVRVGRQSNVGAALREQQLNVHGGLTDRTRVHTALRSTEKARRCGRVD